MRRGAGGEDPINCTVFLKKGFRRKDPESEKGSENYV